MKARRVHPRYPVGEFGFLKPLEWESLIGKREARIVNASGGGLALQLDEAVPVGIEVRVVMTSGKYLGKTTYCRKLGDVFIVGIAAHGSTASIPKRGSASKKRAS